VPRFLIQAPIDIRRKFLELEDLQNKRLTESLNSLDSNSRWKIDDSQEARSRNRYSNIAAWERNRVRLNVPEETCDYINASPINLRSRKDGSLKRYIATQGPKEGQLNHMWRMIWQETSEVAVVVMLTKTYELGRDKCFQYFPDNDPTPWNIRDDGEFGDGFEATVTLVEKKKDVKSACTVRKLLMTVGEKKKIVWHLFFKGWPDYNVPEGDDKSALMELIKLANEKNTGPDNPLIVHCSAGVGRSGTFITLDHFIRDIDAGAIPLGERGDLVFETVNQLREQRMYMVQSEVQFQFIYTVLRERYQRRSKSSSPPAATIKDDDSATHHSA
jgi:protein-tyrosine phosphatase